MNTVNLIILSPSKFDIFDLTAYWHPLKLAETDLIHQGFPVVLVLEGCSNCKGPPAISLEPPSRTPNYKVAPAWP